MFLLCHSDRFIVLDGMDAITLADRIVAFITQSSLLTPMLEIQRGGLSNVVDMSTPQVIGEPVIRLTNINWRRFLMGFGGNEKTLRKRVDEEYLLVKTDKEIGNQRLEHCYVKGW